MEAGDSRTETGDAQGDGGPCACVLEVVGAPGWYGGAGVDTGGRGRL